MRRADAALKAVLAQETALTADAAKVGPWRALGLKASGDAVAFGRDLVHAQSWLADHAGPKVKLSWKVGQAVRSCDGSIVTTFGSWHEDAIGDGFFIRVWQRMSDGSYKWRAMWDQTTKTAVPLPEKVETVTADCGIQPPAINMVQTAPTKEFALKDKSSDGKIDWLYRVTETCDRQFSLWMWQDGKYVEYITVLGSNPPRQDGAPWKCLTAE